MSLYRLASLPILGLSLVAAACGGREVTSAPLGSGGAGVGGSNTGGSGGSGGMPPSPGCQVEFVSPLTGDVLTHRDDANGDRCADGFQYDVEVTTTAPDGAVGLLFSGTQQVGSAVAQGGRAVFEGVQLTSQGTASLLVAFSSGTGCEAAIELEVDCGVPTCDLVAPVLTPSKPKLNGVAAILGGDRVSPPGAPYQAAFQVETNIADGQPVVLYIGDQPSGFSALAQNGIATFPGVTLSPDGEYVIEAACFGEEGVVGRSAEGIYTVDTAPPNLTVQKVLGGTSVTPLENGDHFGPGDDADPAQDGYQIRICGATTSADAIDFPAGFGAAQSNLCVAVGTSTPQCTPAVSDGAPDSDGACLLIDCPGAGTFSLQVTLKDDAGNPTTHVVENLTCASSNPSVQFLDPVSDSAPFDQKARRILAANNPTATRRDKDGATPGAQYDVVACTTATSGTARLLGGPLGAPAVQLATTALVPAGPSDNCPPGMVSKAVFMSATLPESSHDASFNLTAPTRLQVEVTDASTAVGSADIQVWVDSTNPELTLNTPANFCGSFIASATSVTRDLVFATALAPVAVTVDGVSCEPTCTPSSTVSFGFATVTGVPFALGTNQLAASVEEPSGNVGSIALPCEVTVGPNVPPTVTWQSPVNTSRLTASTTSGGVALPDTDANAPGWQGTLRVCTNIDLAEHPDAQVQFSVVGGGDIGGPQPLVADGGGSCAELSGATVPEGNPVQLRATTTEVNGAVGVATISVPVDVTPPAAVTGLTPSVLDRRATSFRLAWTAPSDGGSGVTGYQVRVSTAPITSGNFDAALAVPYGNAVAAPGAPDGVDVLNRLIETDYYFAVAAVDAVGNRGPVTATDTPTRAQFLSVLLPGAVGSGENAGSPVDGSADLDGDGFSDIIVGNLLSSTSVRIYFGDADGPSSTGRVTTITGSIAGFGAAVAAVDLSGDGRPELAVGSFLENAVYVFNGRADWPSSLSVTDANAVIRLDSSLLPEAANAGFGTSLARLGDFDGDGRQDLAIGAPYFDAGRGLVAVIRGQAGGLPATTTLPTAFGTAAFRFEGSPGVVGNFGWSLIGLGNFFGSTRTDLIVAAPLQSQSGSSRGAVYAYGGRAINGVTVYPDEADAALHGAANNELIGVEGFAALGRIGPQGQPALGLPLRWAGTKGRIRLLSGSAESGPFASLLGELTTTEVVAGRLIGRVAVGGGFSGTSAGVSFIRSSAPDLVVPSSAGPKLFFLSNETLQGLSGGSPVELSAVADLVYELPDSVLPWADFGRNVTAARDVNGDGYGDLLLGEVHYSEASDGKVLVLY